MPKPAPTLKRFLLGHYRLWQYARIKRRLAALKLMRLDLIDAAQQAHSILDERERRLSGALMEWDLRPDE